MPSRRDVLKAAAGLVLATGGTWLATHARGAMLDLAVLSPQSARTLTPRNLDVVSRSAPPRCGCAGMELACPGIPVRFSPLASVLPPQ